ncbi:MAG: HAD-IA family hydrolase [Elainellaceae cyanobacterium]
MKVVIFDFDGTLGDTLDVLLAIANHLAYEFNYPPLDRDTLQRFQQMDSREVLRQSQISIFKIPFLMRRLKLEMSHHMESIQLFEGMEDALRELHAHGHRLGILTSNSAENVEAFLEAQQIRHLFDFVYSGKTIFGKHRVLKRIFRQHNIDLSTAIYVGDETRDIEAAKKVAIDTISVTWGFNTRPILERHQPTHVIDTPGELVHILNHDSSTCKTPS